MRFCLYNIDICMVKTNIIPNDFGFVLYYIYAVSLDFVSQNKHFLKEVCAFRLEWFIMK